MIETATRSPTKADLLADYLGPAEVIVTGPSRVRVLIGETTTEAQLALAFTYEPVPGDVCLVAARHGRAYVIGILEGRGRTSLAIPGDVELHAVGGRLRLRGDEGVELEGRDVRITAADKLRVTAERAVSSFGSLTRRVRELFTAQSGDVIDTVDNARVEKARHATILTEETMAINGREIHLG